MLLQFWQWQRRNYLQKAKQTACVKQICLLCVYVKLLIEKHCLVKHFAFLKNVGYQYLNFVLRVTYCFFLQAADWPTTNFLGMYCYFPVIRLVNFVYVAPVTVVAL